MIELADTSKDYFLHENDCNCDFEVITQKGVARTFAARVLLKCFDAGDTCSREEKDSAAATAQSKPKKIALFQ